MFVFVWFVMGPDCDVLKMPDFGVFYFLTNHGTQRVSAETDSQFEFVFVLFVKAPDSGDLNVPDFGVFWLGCFDFVIFHLCLPEGVRSVG